LQDIVARALDGESRAIAKLISMVEHADPRLPKMAEMLNRHVGRAHVVGLTGPPGVGKSTTTSMLISALRGAGRRVAVLAVDPSSPYTGGALLGDRVRMIDHGNDSDVFIRSMASRGQLGGLAWAAPQAIRILDAAGFDVVLVETVGVGQSEIDVVTLSDTTVVVMAPGMGDGIQAAKAGVLEVADVFVVNKADREGVGLLQRDLQNMLATSGRSPGHACWSPPIVTTVASRRQGAPELVAALSEHLAWLRAGDEILQRRAHRAASEVEGIAMRALQNRLNDIRNAGRVDSLARQVVDGSLDPFSAASALLDDIRG
jgi:LAO/AO transport system kinase